MQDKLTTNKGFTFLESLLVLLIIAILLQLTLPISVKRESENIKAVINEITYLQFLAIMEGERQYYDKYDCDIRFNRLGHINMANTYHIGNTNLIVSLGTGKVYVKK